MSVTHRILLVEDEVKLGKIICDELTSNGYQTDLAVDGLEASKLFSENTYALVLLDINLPYKNGYVLCREFRDQNKKIPIIMLSAAGEIHDKVEAFNIGADDYIVKPFSMKELLSRINVFLRRNKMFIQQSPLAYKVGKYSFVPGELQLQSNDETIALTTREKELLEFLCLHPNMVLKREEILSNVWGKNDFFLGRSMDVFITRLRRHLQGEPAVTIETIHGVGYRFTTE